MAQDYQRIEEASIRPKAIYLHPPPFRPPLRLAQDVLISLPKIDNQPPAPSDPAAVLAGIPSAVETFRRLVGEMKEAGTEALIVDLSQNGGGNSLMADILTYYLYGTQKLAEIAVEESSVTKYSPYYFAQLTGRTIDDLNRQYAQIQSYPLTENDYDFSYERYANLFRSTLFLEYRFHP